MRSSSIAIIGGLFLLTGLVGLTVMFVLGGTAMMSGPLYESGIPDSASLSLGERIYFEGVGEDGPIRRVGGIGHMGSGGCATCHGADAQGGTVGMMFAFQDAPPVDYGTLTRMHDEHGDGDESDAWTDEDISRAIRHGILPDGDRLDLLMPRWDMSDTDMEALIEYLKTLDKE